MSFPPASLHPLTAWSIIDFHLPSLLQQFANFGSQDTDAEARAHQRTYMILPSGPYSHMSYIKIYATCRLRRIWLSDLAHSPGLPWEFELCGA